MRLGTPTSPATSDSVLKTLQDDPVRKDVTRIAADEPGVLKGLLKDAMDKALTGDKVRAVISAVLFDALTQGTLVDAVVSALKDYEGYK